MPHNQTCDLETYGLELEFTRDLKAKVLVSVSRPGGQGLGLGLETWWFRSWSWSRDLRKSLDLEIQRPRSRPVILKTNYIYKKPGLWSLRLINDYIYIFSRKSKKNYKIGGKSETGGKNASWSQGGMDAPVFQDMWITKSFLPEELNERSQNSFRN